MESASVNVEIDGKHGSCLALQRIILPPTRTSNIRTSTGMTWLMIRNPASGNGRRSGQALDIARERGLDVVTSEHPGEAVDLAAEAATQGITHIAACGGDGTTNEVVKGIDQAGRLSEITMGVIPTGTANGFARDIGITSVRQGFDVLEEGRERRIDVGMADSRPFLKSCISGFPADVSAHTTPELKRFTGILAYGLGILPYILEIFRTHQLTPPEISVRAGSAEDPVWEGRAVLVLAGNSRRFPGIVSRRADVEDGLLDVVIVKRQHALAELREPQNVQVRNESNLRRLHVAELEFSSDSQTPYSLDGEVIKRRNLAVTVRPSALRFRVGPDYSVDSDSENDAPTGHSN